jgi:hypothetical protein
MLAEMGIWGWLVGGFILLIGGLLVVWFVYIIDAQLYQTGRPYWPIPVGASRVRDLYAQDSPRGADD